MQARVTTARSDYESSEKFLKMYHPDNSVRMVMRHTISGLINADTPTLTVIRYAFGEATVTTFISNFLRYWAKNNAVADKLSPSALFDTAVTVLNECHYWKISEIVAFFAYAKTGSMRNRKDEDAAKMYGEFNGEVVMDCLYMFKRIRDRIIEDREAEENTRKHDEMMKNAVPPPPGALKKVFSTLQSIGHSEKPKTLADMKSIGKDHITTFSKMGEEELERRRINEAKFQALLERQKTTNI